MSGVSEVTTRRPMTHAMTKLKDSVSRLREHLDRFQHRRSMPVFPATSSVDEFFNEEQDLGDVEVPGHPPTDFYEEMLNRKYSQTAMHLSHGALNGLGVVSGGGNMSHGESIPTLNGGMAMSRSVSYPDGDDIGENVSTNLARKKRKARLAAYSTEQTSSDSQVSMPKSTSLQNLDSQLPPKTSATSSVKLRHAPSTHGLDQVRMRRRHSEVALDAETTPVQGWREKQQQLEDKRRSLQDVSSIFGALPGPHNGLAHIPLSLDGSARSSSAASRQSNTSGVTSPGSSQGGLQRSKPRRTLPRLPQNENDLEQRKQRMSTEALTRVKLAQIQATSGGVKSKHVSNSKPVDENEDDRDSVKTLSGGADSVVGSTGSPASTCYHHSVQATSEVANGKKSQSTPHPRSQHRIPQEQRYHAGHQEVTPSHAVRDQDRREQFDDAGMVEHSASGGAALTNGKASHYSLQQIISDLRFAAARPIEANAQINRIPSYSSASSVSHDSSEHLHRRDAQPEMGLDISPLARCAPRDYLNDSCDSISALHPSLHRITASYDLHTVILENPSPGYIADYGIDVFEASFIDCPASDKVLNGVSSPVGRRAVIGRKKGAFRPVSSSSSVDSGPMLSLVAVDTLLENSLAAHSGRLREGDYVIEVNGMYVANSSADVVRSEIYRQQQSLELVVARPKETVANSTVGQLEREHSEAMLTLHKEKEKLQLKYNAVKLDSEKTLDQLADYKLDQQAKEGMIAGLQETLEQRESVIRSLESQLLQREKAVHEWQTEVQRRNANVLQLQEEVRHRDGRIAQLRKLLVQQSELIDAQEFGTLDYDGDEDDDGDNNNGGGRGGGYGEIGLYDDGQGGGFGDFRLHGDGQGRGYGEFGVHGDGEGGGYGEFGVHGEKVSAV